MSWHIWAWSCSFLSLQGLAWPAALKKTKLKLHLLIDIDISLMVEKGIRGGTCHAIHRYTEANKKYIKKYDKNKESSYLKGERKELSKNC